MARKKKAAAPLDGAAEFAGPDTTKEAMDKIAEARAAAETQAAQDAKKGDNGGPPLDTAAWSRAVTEYTAEMLEIEDLEKKRSEVSGRISSIRKRSKKLGVDWDLVKRYYEDHKAIRKGKMGAMVSDERRYRWLLKVMDSPLGTQFTLWEVETEDEAKPKMEPELAGQHAFSNGEPITNNPYLQGTVDFVDWEHGYNQAMAAKAREMAPAAGEGAATH